MTEQDTELPQEVTQSKEEVPHFETFGEMTRALGFERIDNNDLPLYQVYEKDIPDTPIGPLEFIFTSQQHRFAKGEEHLTFSVQSPHLDCGTSTVFQQFLDQMEVAGGESEHGWYKKEFLKKQGYGSLYTSLKEAFAEKDEESFLSQLQTTLLEIRRKMEEKNPRLEEEERQKALEKEQEEIRRQEAEEKRDEAYFASLIEQVQAKFPEYTAVDNHYTEDRTFSFIAEKDKQETAPVLTFAYKGEGFNIMQGTARFQHEKIFSKTYSKFPGNMPTLPQPRRNLDWEDMHWEEDETDLALEKLQIMREGITLTPDVLATVVGWSEKRDEPITLQDYISYHHPTISQELGIPLSGKDNYEEFYINIYPRGIKSPEQLQKAAIANLQMQEESVIIKGHLYEPHQLIAQIEQDTPIGREAIAMLKNRVSAYEKLLEAHEEVLHKETQA